MTEVPPDNFDAGDSVFANWTNTPFWGKALVGSMIVLFFGTTAVLFLNESSD
ncbi:MAG: hypothetical protein AAB955_00515 [Patescibacteria group bacterium]